VIINGSRRVRIAEGSGTQVGDVNRLVKQFGEMQKMMKKMGGMGSAKRGKKGKRGRALPPGMDLDSSVDLSALQGMQDLPGLPGPPR
ncbi:MAG: signal recognition particle protein, partial [Acidimicrobiia bacterium]|nr:signal recognition particle protein [Acidimicrobiia bacterium]